MRKRPKLTEQRFDKWADDLRSWIRESVSPFEGDSPEAQQQRKKKAATDLLYFCQTYLPHYFTSDFGEFHEEWEELTEIRDEFIPLAAPREHAKSTFFSFAVPIRNICHELRHFQLIISDSNDQATGFTLAIRVELETNPRLRYDFGDLVAAYGRRSVQWQKGDFLTANGIRVLARGRGEKVRGLKNRQYRPDYAAIDDFENDTNVQNPKMVTNGMRWIRRAVLGSMAEGFTALMVGNLFHPKSALSQFIAEKDEDGNPLYTSRIYRAWTGYGTPDQRPLWPARWSPERLEKKRWQMSARDFNAEMMNLTGDEDSPFREEWFRFFERAYITVPEMRVATFTDPSAKNGEGNDYKAIITVGVTGDMVFHCLHAWIRRASIGEMFAAAYHQHDSYGGQVGIEENMLKDFLHEAIANYAKQVGRYLPWIPVHHSTNKEARIIGTLSYLVEHGRLVFERGHSDQNLLREQLVYILNKNVNDDGPDALEGAVSLLQTSGGALVA